MLIYRIFSILDKKDVALFGSTTSLFFVLSDCIDCFSVAFVSSDLSDCFELLSIWPGISDRTELLFIWSTAFDSTCFSFLFQTVHTILVNLIARIFFDHKLSCITSVFLLSDPVICFKLFCFSIMIVTKLLLPSDNPLFFWVSCFRIYYQYMSASKKRNA